MKNLKKFHSFIKEDQDQLEIIKQNDDDATSPENKIEVPQDNWEDWKDKLEPNIKYSSCEIFIDEDDSTLSIISPSLKFVDESSIMIRYTKQSQKDPQLEAKLEKLKSDKVIERMHFMSLVDPEAFIIHLGNLKSVTK